MNHTHVPEHGTDRSRSWWPLVLWLGLAAGLSAAGSCIHGDRRSGDNPSRLASRPAELQRYKNAFYEALGHTVQGPSSRQELVRDVRDAEVLLLGDFHSDRAYHQRALALLDDLADHVGPLLLIVEFLRWEDQDDLACYFAREITLDQLRRRVLARHPRAWIHPDALDPEGFLRFLVRARERGWIVHPVENIRQPPLLWRDQVIARRARVLMEENRGYYPVIFFGQAHLLGHDRLEPRLGLKAVTVLPRLPRTRTGRPPAPSDGIQRIRDRIYFLGPETERPDIVGPERAGDTHTGS